jgi:hypothetical protein
MSVDFTIKEETHGRWGIYRGSDLLISEPSVADAITDARELARVVHVKMGAVVTLALDAPGTSILLARYALPAAATSRVAA